VLGSVVVQETPQSAGDTTPFRRVSDVPMTVRTPTTDGLVTPRSRSGYAGATSPSTASSRPPGFLDLVNEPTHAPGKEVNTMTFVTREELAREEVELLPSRETLAFFNWANVSATNVALAQNTYTLLSAASASANQAVLVSQS
jgi:hypothetical protein